MAAVSGRITIHRSEPAKLATVEIHNSVGDHVSQTVVGDDGGYRFHLAPGVWSLNVYDPYGHRGRVEFELGDDDKTIDLDLEDPEGADS